jgi:hypothetical protein
MSMEQFNITPEEAETQAFEQVLIDPDLLKAAQMVGEVLCVPEVKDGRVVSVTVKDSEGKIVAFKDVAWFEEQMLKLQERLSKENN